MHLVRLQPNQTEQITKVKGFREEATNLRSLVSQGAYEIREAQRFWKLAGSAGIILQISNSELAERAGVGRSFFTTVVRDERLPKLANFLRALSTLIEVADERLFEVGGAPKVAGATDPQRTIANSRIKQDHAELLALARSLSQMARGEIEELDSRRPNEPDTVERYERQRELLEIFADGFDRLADALANLAERPNESILLGRASEIVNSVGNQVTAWWAANGAEAVDWAVRLPTFVGGVAALGWAGANMTVGTTAVAALVGGAKVLNAIKGRKKK